MRGPPGSLLTLLRGGGGGVLSKVAAGGAGGRGAELCGGASTSSAGGAGAAALLQQFRAKSSVSVPDNLRAAFGYCVKQVKWVDWSQRRQHATIAAAPWLTACHVSVRLEGRPRGRMERRSGPARRTAGRLACMLVTDLPHASTASATTTLCPND